MSNFVVEGLKAYSDRVR